MQDSSASTRARFGPLAVGNGPLVLIAGPCVIESAEHVKFMAEKLVALTADLGLPFVFKASYDKANRSSLNNFRGPGLEEGLRLLETIRRDLGVPVLSDVHSVEETRAAGQVLDVLQVPAFLCRQTDLLLAAGATGKAVNVKKGQFLAPWDMKNVLAKVRESGNENVTLTERGVSFGYNNLVADLRSLPIMRQMAPVIFDATHAVQLPGGQGHASGGDRAMAEVLARAAVAAGVDGLFLEVHDDPDRALCDGPNMIALRDLPRLLKAALAIHEVVRASV